MVHLLCLGLQWRAVAKFDPQARVETARVYGNLNQFAYYFIDMVIGPPTQQQLTSVILDTGSHLVGFPCRGCDHCGEHIEPAFDFNKSSTARWVDCHDNCKGTCGEGNWCAYTESYTEGSSLTGLWFEDYVQLGDLSQANPPVRARMGCHRRENNLFYSQKVNGIMGLAPTASKGMQTILDDLFKDKAHVNSRIFSLCLSRWGGVFTVGGYNAKHHENQSRNAIAWLMMGTSGYYYIFTKSLKLGDVLVAVDPNEFGATFVDSGTTMTYFPSLVYDTLLSDLNIYCSTHNECGGRRMPSPDNNCWELAFGPNEFPDIHFSFDGENGDVQVAWPATSYLNRRYGREWCLTFMRNTRSQTVLGVSFFLHKDVIFDLDLNRLGLAEARCPERTTVPEQLWQQFAPPKEVAVLSNSQLFKFSTSNAAILAAACATIFFACSHTRQRKNDVNHLDVDGAHQPVEDSRPLI